MKDGEKAKINTENSKFDFVSYLVISSFIPYFKTIAEYSLIKTPLFLWLSQSNSLYYL